MQTRGMEREIESTFKHEKKKFQIEASAKAFQILSSNLYTDKPLAIVRELSCNALDSHWEAKQEKPFQIILPNSLNPVLEIRDFGTGMAPNKVETLYMTFFGSDKSKSNDAIGGLGLGSKTPFSYTDTFTLLSYWEGIVYTWLCYIDEEGEPATQRVSEEKTEEGNGIQYIIPVKQEDFSTFRNKAQTVLRYFPEGSFNVNTDIESMEYSVKTDFYGLRAGNEGYNGKEARVVMGPVSYILKFDALSDDNKQKHFRTLTQQKQLDIFCEIGDIDVQASREALSYDKKSQQKIVDVLEKVYVRVKQDIEDAIQDCDTYLEACEKGQDLSDGFGSLIGKLHWKGKQLQTTFSITATSSAVSNDNITEGNALRVGFTQHNYYGLKTIVNCEVALYESSVPHNNRRLKHYLEENYGQTLILFNDTTEMYGFMMEIGIFDCLDVADFELPELEVSDTVVYQRSKTPVKMKLRDSGGDWRPITKTIEDINELENTCWVPLEGNRAEPWANMDHSTIYYALNRTLEFFQVIGVPKSLMHKVKLLEIPSIEEFARGKIIELIDTEARFNAAFAARSDIDWLNHLADSATKDHAHINVCQYAQLHTRTNSISQLRDVTKLLGWDTSVTFSSIDESLFRKKYKVFESLKDLYSGRRKLTREILKLTDGEGNGVHHK